MVKSRGLQWAWLCSDLFAKNVFLFLSKSEDYTQPLTYLTRRFSDHLSFTSPRAASCLPAGQTKTLAQLQMGEKKVSAQHHQPCSFQPAKE